MHDMQVQIRCQRCGDQMELKDPGPDDPWPPQQFWECSNCGRHFWTTYPPPKKPKPQVAPKQNVAGQDVTIQASSATAAEQKAQDTGSKP